MHLIIIILIILILIYIIYNKYQYEHMTPELEKDITLSKKYFSNEAQHTDICQIQQPQLGKGRPYVNWQKIHNFTTGLDRKVNNNIC
jgi:hypothetical protein